MTALNVKLDNLFRVDTNLAVLMAYESFESYATPEDTPIKDYLIEFNHQNMFARTSFGLSSSEEC